MNKTDEYQPAILAPAGNRASFLAALAAGADAVYCGLKSMSARMEAKNFSLMELAQLVRLAHDREVKVYVTVPTHDGAGVNADLVQWMLTLPKWPGVEWHCDILREKPVVSSRNRTVKRFLESDCDVFFSIDDDMIPMIDAGCGSSSAARSRSFSAASGSCRHPRSRPLASQASPHCGSRSSARE